MDATNLCKLIEESNMARHDVAEACGIKLPTLITYCRGAHNPTVDIMIRLADFFAVPLDYICGRCTKEECDAIEESFADNFKLLRKETYENVVIRNRSVLLHEVKYSAPYPYNLLDDIFMDPFDHVLTEEELSGLDAALSSLTERERKGIEDYYQKEMAMEEIGREFGVGAQRTRQIIAKGLRKLRHPVRANQILHADRERKLNEREKRLDQRECYIAENERRLAEKMKEVDLTKCTEVQYDEDDEIRTHGYTECSVAFLKLDLSVRAFNCCVRSRLNTVKKLLKAIKTPHEFCPHDCTLIQVRNLGFKSYNEILYAVEKATGEDLSAYREGYGIFDDNGQLIRKDDKNA